jgi:hypothetical protein
MPLPTDYARVTRRQRCPICDGPDWCLIKRDGTQAVCPRVWEGCAREWWSKAGNFLGYVHVLREDVRQYVRRMPAREPEVKLDVGSALELMLYASEACAWIGQDIGVSWESLLALGTRWNRGHDAAAFPMSDADGCYIGIRLRRPSGFKWAVKGSRNGIFLPAAMPDGPVLIPEGPTDTAACLDLGYAAIGRPCAQAGFGYVLEWFRREDRAAVVVGEAFDKRGDGVRFAEKLAELLSSNWIRTQVIYPPVKDIRQWKHDGAGHDDVQALIDNAPLRRAG